MHEFTTRTLFNTTGRNSSIQSLAIALHMSISHAKTNLELRDKLVVFRKSNPDLTMNNVFDLLFNIESTYSSLSPNLSPSVSQNLIKVYNMSMRELNEKT